LIIALGASYLFSWLRFEDGSENECEICFPFLKREESKAELYGEQNDYQNADL
jgi:hypothetical protein